MSDETPEQEKPGIVKLTEEQLQEIVKRVQAAILKQAKRSRRTGVQMPPEKT